MNDKRCQETRARLHALRAGELARLERRAVEAHLAGCQSCTAELWLQAELEDAAKRGPEPLSDLKKRELFSGIQRQLLGVPTPTPKPGFAWPRLWVPAVSLALAVVAVLGALTLSRRPASEAAPAIARGWVIHDSDVQAFATTAASASFSRDANRPVLRLGDGALAVRFERRPDSAPLEVRTPDLTVIVRGTVLLVSVEHGVSTVSVQHGRVEVLSAGGETVFVTDGERAEPSSRGFLRQPATTGETRQMAEVFGEPTPTPAPSINDTPAPTPAHAPLAPPPTALHRPTPPAAGAIPAAPPPDPVELARARWRNGDAGGAVGDLQAILARPDSAPRQREEALYLVATIERELKEYREAARAFAELMHSDASTPTVRLARLERARLLAVQLDARAEALSELSVLTADGARDAVADAAAFERCAILIEERELAPARACLTDYLASFDNGSHTGECAILLDRLSGTKPRSTQP